MRKYNYQDPELIKLWDDWHALIKQRGKTDPDTPERAELDKKYVKVLPLVAMVTDPKYRAKVPDLAREAMKILEDKKE